MQNRESRPTWLMTILLLLPLGTYGSLGTCAESTCRGETPCAPNANQPPTVDSEATREASDLDVSQEAIREAFARSSDGWSVDEVLIHDERRQKFLAIAFERTRCQDERTILEALIKLRKAGKLQIKSSQQNREDVSDAMPAAEIAARIMQDQQQVLIDQILVDPAHRLEFDRIAISILPEESTYRLRKAALRLRKSRQLTPELTLRVVDWKRSVIELSVTEAMADFQQIPKQAGIYIFRDRTGYLYVGQSNNLRERLSKHLVHSDRASLGDYLQEHATSEIQLELHVFEKGSPAQETWIREAYESELIRSRRPRLNLSP